MATLSHCFCFLKTHKYLIDNVSSYNRLFLGKWPLDPITHFIYLCVCGLALEEEKIVKRTFEDTLDQ